MSTLPCVRERAGAEVMVRVFTPRGLVGWTTLLGNSKACRFFLSVKMGLSHFGQGKGWCALLRERGQISLLKRGSLCRDGGESRGGWNEARDKAG